MEERRRQQRAVEIPEELRKLHIQHSSNRAVEARVIDISSIGVRVEMQLSAADSPWKRGEQVVVETIGTNCRWSALIVYVESSAQATTLGLFFSRPNEQNQLARLLTQK